MKQLFMGEAFGRGCHVSKWVTAGVIGACLALIAPAAARKPKHSKCVKRKARK